MEGSSLNVFLWISTGFGLFCFVWLLLLLVLGFLELSQSDSALSFTAATLRLPESWLERCTLLSVQALTRTIPKKSFVQTEPSWSQSSCVKSQSFFLSWSHSRIRGGTVCQCLQPNFSCRIINVSLTSACLCVSQELWSTPLDCCHSEKLLFQTISKIYCTFLPVCYRVFPRRALWCIAAGCWGWFSRHTCEERLGLLNQTSTYAELFGGNDSEQNTLKIVMRWNAIAVGTVHICSGLCPVNVTRKPGLQE